MALIPGCISTNELNLQKCTNGNCQCVYIDIYMYSLKIDGCYCFICEYSIFFLSLSLSLSFHSFSLFDFPDMSIQNSCRTFLRKPFHKYLLLNLFPLLGTL